MVWVWGVGSLNTSWDLKSGEGYFVLGSWTAILTVGFRGSRSSTCCKYLHAVAALTRASAEAVTVAED